MLLEHVFVPKSCCVVALWRVDLWLRVLWANMVGRLFD